MHIKRVLLIIGFVFAILVLGMALYIAFFAPTPTIEVPDDVEPNPLPPIAIGDPTIIGDPTRLPGSISEVPLDTEPADQANGTLTKSPQVVTGRVGFSRQSGDGQGISYYQKTTGKFFRIKNDGVIDALSDTVFHNVDAVTWAPNGNKAVLEYPDGSNIVYDFQKQRQVTIPKHWEDFSFDPSSAQLAFKSIGVDADNRWLGIANDDGSAAEAIAALGANQDSVTVSWSPARQIVAYQREHTGADRQEVFFVGLHQENFKSMTVPGVGFKSQWTPDGQRLLYSTSSAQTNYKPLLWVADAVGEQIGQNRKSIQLHTWADKCTFASSSKIICAVPNELPRGAGLARGVANNIPDNIYEIDVDSGQRRLLAIPASNITARSLTVTNDGRSLFIEDERTEGIYQINL